MLMNRRVKLRRYERAMSRLLAGRIGAHGEASGELDLHLDFAALIEVPVEPVVVIADGGEKRDHQPPRSPHLNGKVAAALVGTFLGILLCYGFVGPIAANMATGVEEERAYYYVLRVVMITFLKGTAPILAVESARRAIPGNVRPSFQEVEKACRGSGNEAPPAAAAASA